jgi:hypothetical protein
MLYPLGQALLWVATALIVLAVFAVPLARWIGRLTHTAQHQHKEVVKAFEEGKKEES